ncbi:hypothetical protein [Micromonospora sp. NBC_00898]
MGISAGAVKSQAARGLASLHLLATVDPTENGERA